FLRNVSMSNPIPLPLVAVNTALKGIRWIEDSRLPSYRQPAESKTLQVQLHSWDTNPPIVEVSAVNISSLFSSDELAFYASLYREALNSNSPVYQFLCLFKIIEGTQARRSRLDKFVVSRGGTPRRLRDRLPADPNLAAVWLNQIFPHKGWDPASVGLVFPSETFGKRMNTVLQIHLRPLRNRVAHGILEPGELTLSTDRSLERSEVERWLPLTKCFTRYLLKQ